MGFEVEGGIKDCIYYPLTFWQLNGDTLISYREELIFDSETNVTENFKHYLKSLEVSSDGNTTTPDKPFCRDDLEDGMVLSLEGIPHLFFVMFGGVHKALTSENFCFMADLDEVTDEWMIYLSDSPTKITKVEYQDKVLFDRAKEDELECLLEQQRERLKLRLNR